MQKAAPAASSEPLQSQPGSSSDRNAAPEEPGRYALLIFDLDGTLVDSAPDICTALGLTLRERGLPEPDVATTRRLVGEGQRVLIERALIWAGVSADEAGQQIEAVLPRFRANYAAHLCERTTIYPGVSEVLARLPGRRVVATNKPGAWARELVQTLGLQALFSHVLGEDDVGARKPDPRLLLHLCAQAGVRPQSALMIGDSRIDLRAAEAAGIDAALCLWGYGDAETLAQARAAQTQLGHSLGSPQRPYLFGAITDLEDLLLGPRLGGQ